MKKLLVVGGRKKKTEKTLVHFSLTAVIVACECVNV